MKRSASTAGQRRMEVVVQIVRPKNTSMARATASVGGVDRNHRAADVLTVLQRLMRNSRNGRDEVRREWRLTCIELNHPKTDIHRKFSPRPLDHQATPCWSGFGSLELHCPKRTLNAIKTGFVTAKWSCKRLRNAISRLIETNPSHPASSETAIDVKTTILKRRLGEITPLKRQRSLDLKLE